MTEISANRGLTPIIENGTELCQLIDISYLSFLLVNHT